MLLFGIFEYARFLLVMHIAHNAARDAARYASVNLDKPANFHIVDFVNAQGTVFPSITRYTRERMGGVDRQIVNMQIEIFPVDSAGLHSNPPVFNPKPGAAWNQADYTEKIAVRITGEFRSLVPTLLLMPASIPIRITAISTPEG